MAVKTVLRRLDYASINFLISGTTISFIYYGYYCEQATVRTMCTVSVTASAFLFALSLT